MEPIVGIVSQSLETRRYMAKLVRELISESGPVLITCLEQNTKRLLRRGAITGHRLILFGVRGTDQYVPIKSLSKACCKVSGYVLKKNPDVFLSAVAPIALNYLYFHFLHAHPHQARQQRIRGGCL